MPSVELTYALFTQSFMAFPDLSHREAGLATQRARQMSLFRLLTTNRGGIGSLPPLARGLKGEKSRNS